jgi:hypothetical protein
MPHWGATANENSNDSPLSRGAKGGVPVGEHRLIPTGTPPAPPLIGGNFKGGKL